MTPDEAKACAEFLGKGYFLGRSSPPDRNEVWKQQGPPYPNIPLSDADLFYALLLRSRELQMTVEFDIGRACNARIWFEMQYGDGDDIEYDRAHTDDCQRDTPLAAIIAAIREYQSMIASPAPPSLPVSGDRPPSV